jgi:hypothetical protein
VYQPVAKEQNRSFSNNGATEHEATILRGSRPERRYAIVAGMNVRDTSYGASAFNWIGG